MAVENSGVFVGPQGSVFPDVRRIAVLRGGGLGDLMFAMPAITALARAYPQAEITLLGTPVARALLEHRAGPVAEVVELPFAEGVRPGAEDPDALDAFFAEMKRRHFDLAVQLHGGGRFSNPFLLRLGARHTIGSRTEDAAMLERTIPYIYYQHEQLRGLEVAGLAGAGAHELEARLTVTGEEQENACRRLDRRTRGLITIHPGATDPRRRWPAQRFAEVATRVVADGCQVVIVGDDSDADAAEMVVSAVRAVCGDDAPVMSLAGDISLQELLGVLAVSDVVLGNDSGPRHLAMATGASTVGLFWMGNLLNAGPMGRTRHRAHVSWVTRCPECGADVTQVGWTAQRCEHDPSFLTEIGVDEVYADVVSLIGSREV